MDRWWMLRDRRFQPIRHLPTDRSRPAAATPLREHSKFMIHPNASPHCRRALFLVIGLMAAAQPALAEGVRIENKIAVFSALDKVTARISKIEVPLNETVKFGSLKVTPRVCYSRPATERPKTTSFVEVTEVQLEGQEQKLFSGWMFAESPALNAVEHPVFDVWLSECKGGVEPEVATRRRGGGQNTDQATDQNADSEAAPRRRRVRR